MKKLAIATAISIVGLLIWGCGGDSAGKEEISPPDPIVGVEIAPILQRTVPVTIVVDGSTDVLDRQTVVSPIDGTVLSLSVEVDTKVKVGDTLALIRTRDSEASISGARRLLAEATNAVQRDDARKALQIAEEGQHVVPVLAGRNGVVVDRMVSAGQTVLANSELLRLIDLSTLDFVANIPLQELSRVTVGQRCLVRFPSLADRSFVGSVASLSVQSDQGNQTAPVRIDFDSPATATTSALSIGMMGTATIAVGEHSDVLVVPVPALLRNDIENTYTIYKVDADSLARAVPVTVGVVDDSLAEVASPLLHAGESVIVKGNYEVSDSTRVSVEMKRRQ